MAGMHNVQQGEHLYGIAQQYGFPDWEKIWNHPQNADLKDLRKDPDVLFPGDQVFIPDPEERDENKPTDARHTFKVSTEKLKLRVVLNRFYGDPYKNTPCIVIVDADRQDLTTDGDALVEREIKSTATKATLMADDTVQVRDTTEKIQREIQAQIGFLDPVTEPSGQRARLANLGYYRLPVDTVDDDEFKSSVEEFQCEHSLAVDGICGPNTQAKLLSEHGC
jgi:N-acetylmuramoyl-L-alanine amidase